MPLKTIVTITNKDYLLGTYIMLASLLEYGNVDNFCFTIMHDGKIDIRSTTRQLIEIKERYKANISFCFHVINFDEFGNNTLNFYKNALTKFNIFKLNYDEFVFLDSDLLILDDVSSLFKIKEDFAACKDMGTPTEFNTGVMHIKKKWLTESNFNFLVDSAKRNFSYRGDQEHINQLVGKKYKVLDSSYNTLKDKYRFLGSWVANVKILHYISKKPWQPYDLTVHLKGNLECSSVEKKWVSYFNKLNLENRIFFLNRKELIKHISKLYPNGIGVEVGVQKGFFSKIILENWNCKKLFLVDPWGEYASYQKDAGAISQKEHDENYNETIKNISKYKEKTEIIKDYSINAAKKFSDNSLDFIYLDAKHDKQGIKEDIEAWLPKVAKNGIIAGHDYTDLIWNENHIQVKSVVDSFFDKVNYTLDGPYPSWWVKKY